MNPEKQTKASEQMSELWIPSQGEEVITYRNGRRLLLCWNPQTGERCHLDVDQDVFLTCDEYLACCPC